MLGNYVIKEKKIKCYVVAIMRVFISDIMKQKGSTWTKQIFSLGTLLFV